MRIYHPASIHISEERTPMNTGTELVVNLQKKYGDGRKDERESMTKVQDSWAMRFAKADETMSNPENAARFAGGVTAITLGALMIAEGISCYINGGSLFFEGVGRGFESVVGVLAVILGASIVPKLNR